MRISEEQKSVQYYAPLASAIFTKRSSPGADQGIGGDERTRDTSSDLKSVDLSD